LLENRPTVLKTEEDGRSQRLKEQAVLPTPCLEEEEEEDDDDDDDNNNNNWTFMSKIKNNKIPATYKVDFLHNNSTLQCTFLYTTWYHLKLFLYFI
jgi:hypothetical protein